MQNDEGDGRFVWFGWPVAHRDDADRAVPMSFDLLERIDPLSRRVRYALADRESVSASGSTPVRRSSPSRRMADPGRTWRRFNLAAKVQQRCDPGEL